MKHHAFLIALGAVSALSATATAATAPRVSAANLDGLRQPLPLPYDEAADSGRQVAQARARARAEGKRLLIDLGGNWCPDCRVLAGVMALPEVGAFVRRHYVVVTVDVGRMDKNLQIPRHYGIDRVAGVPAVLIVDPTTDRLINRDHLFALADARHMTPQALADWLAQWV
jgi:thiol-disulfide isomerase/thioredoxin